jgi:hypothetical protein
MNNRINMTKLRALALGGLLALTFAHADAATITASSCAQSAVQGAVNSAADGDIVVVPSGSCTWTSPLQISGKGIHLKGQAKGSVNITHSVGNANLISVSTDASHSVEISNLTLLPGSVSGGADYLSVSGSGRPALVHDNYFRNVGFTAGCIHWSAVGGVVWNNTFESLEADGSSGGCFRLKSEGLVNSWSTASTMGTADSAGTANVYIEGNSFKKILLQSIDVDDNMRAVIRYNTFDNSGFVYHGADTSASGVRHVEVYNNKFLFTTSGSGYNFPLNINWWLFMRGGTGVWADNDVPAISSQMWGNKPVVNMTVQNLRRSAGPYPCWKTYPAPHQVGQSHNGSSAVTDPFYIWGNTGSGSQSPSISDYDQDSCGTGNTSANFIRSGRDFVIGSAKPGYTKYVYPHPLTAGSGSSAAAPVAPAALTAPTGLRVQ